MSSPVRSSTLALLCALSPMGCGATEGDAAEPAPASTGDEPSRDRVEREPGACDSDGDCREEDNYCGGCHCLTLGPGETAPTCQDPVACFASPCSVTPGRPACVDHRCVRVTDEDANR